MWMTRRYSFKMREPLFKGDLGGIFFFTARVVGTWNMLPGGWWNRMGHVDYPTSWSRWPAPSFSDIQGEVALSWHHAIKHSISFLCSISSLFEIWPTTLVLSSNLAWSLSRVLPHSHECTECLWGVEKAALLGTGGENYHGICFVYLVGTSEPVYPCVSHTMCKILV